ncbi:MAG: hypothetical protein WC712_08760 [Candidatus Brocadiia bacterium]
MSAKKNETENEPEVREAFEAWLAAQGGKEQLVSRMRAEKVAKLITEASWETKLEELDEKAKNENLLDGLKELTLAQLKAILAPEPQTPSKRGRGRRPGRSAKSTSGKRGESTTAILKYIAGHPDCRNAEIAKGTGLDAKKSAQHLTYIRKNGWVATKGKLRGMTYRISPEGKRRIVA